MIAMIYSTSDPGFVGGRGLLLSSLLTLSLNLRLPCRYTEDYPITPLATGHQGAASQSSDLQVSTVTCPL